MRIRPATDSDAEAVAGLWTEAYSGRGDGEGRRLPYETSEFFDSARGGEAFVAEDGGELLGAIVFYPPTAPGRTIGGEGEAALTRLAVAGAARGRGIGRALVGLCRSRARETGATALVLWSRRYQTPAHRLYESLGFRRAPERDGADPEGARLVFVDGLEGPG